MMTSFMTRTDPCTKLFQGLLLDSTEVLPAAAIITWDRRAMAIDSLTRTMIRMRTHYGPQEAAAGRLGSDSPNVYIVACKASIT